MFLDHYQYFLLLFVKSHVPCQCAPRLQQISLARIRSEKALKGAPDWLCRVLARVLVGKPPWAMLTPKLFAHLRARGIPVWFMGVNSEEEMHTAVLAGATGVLTDRVRWAVEYTQANHMHFKTIE